MKQLSSQLNYRLLRLAAQLSALVAVVLLASGCAGTFQEIKPVGAELGPPKERPTALALGDIKITDSRIAGAQQQVLIGSFKMGVEKWCAKQKTFAFSPSITSTNAIPNSIVLNGLITEVNTGSATARFLVGMGAGQERIVGRFTIDTLGGKDLASFTARKSYLGGAGAGGWDMLSMGDLMEQLGQLVAATTDKWARGEKLQ